MSKKKLNVYDRIIASDLLSKFKLIKKSHKQNEAEKHENLKNKGPERGDRKKGPQGGRRVNKGLSREERGEFREINED